MPKVIELKSTPKACVPDISPDARGPVPRKHTVLIPVCGVTLIVLLVKVAGFGEKIVIAKYLGTSQAADCYYAAFAVMWTIVFVVRELLQPTCLPVYLSVVASSDGRGVGDRLVSAIAGCLALLLGVMACVMATWPVVIVGVFVPGFGDEARMEAAGLVRTMSIGIAVLTFTGLTKTLLDAHRRFWWSALGEFAFRLVYLIGLVFSFGMLSLSSGVGLSIALAALTGLGLHALILRQHLQLRRPRRSGAEIGSLRQMLLLAGPLVVGVAFSHVGQLVDTVLASMLAPGRLSALTYAKKLTDAIVLMGPVALSTVLFSHFSSLAAAGRVEELRGRLRRCLAVLIAASIPVAALVVGLRYPLVKLLFARGHFDTASIALTADALGCYGLGIVAMAVESLLVSTFYALKEMKTPTYIGMGSVTCDIILSWSLMQIWGHVGIALAVSLTKSIKVCVLLIALNRRLARVIPTNA